MIKGYEVNQPLEAVQTIIEKALAGEGVALPKWNALVRTASAVFPDLGYVWFNWRAKGDGTLVTLESQKEATLEAAYKKFFETGCSCEKKAEPEVVKDEAVFEEVVVEEEVAVSDNAGLSIDVLGLKGRVGKSFAKNSGCKTLGDVAKLSLAELEAINGIGGKTVVKIVEAMAAYGFEIK